MLLLALLLASGAAAAQSAPSLTLEVVGGSPPALEPGGSEDIPVRVAYCYERSSAVAAEVTLAVGTSPTWATGSVSPTSFQATKPAGARCDEREVTLAVDASRDAPAFDLEMVRLDAVARVAGDRSEGRLDVPLQANYAVELSVQAPERVRAGRGDLTTVPLVLRLGANAATRVELTGQGDPEGQVTVQGQVLRNPEGVGRGLDQPPRLEIPVSLAVSPRAEPGLYDVHIRLQPQYELNPDFAGPAREVRVEVEVVGGGIPGPTAGLAVPTAACAALMLGQRGGKRPGRRGRRPWQRDGGP